MVMQANDERMKTLEELDVGSNVPWFGNLANLENYVGNKVTKNFNCLKEMRIPGN